MVSVAYVPLWGGGPESLSTQKPKNNGRSRGFPVWRAVLCFVISWGGLLGQHRGRPRAGGWRQEGWLGEVRSPGQR